MNYEEIIHNILELKSIFLKQYFIIKKLYIYVYH